MVVGRKPNLKRWRRIEELRAAGLCLPEIGRRLGCSHQAVASTLRTIAQSRERVRSVACAGCREPLISAGVLPSDRGKALCLDCLAKRPEVPFGRRLQAFRLAAGLTRAELEAAAGFIAGTVQRYEKQGETPRWRRIVRLVKILGVGLVAFGFEGYTGEGLRGGWGTDRGNDQPARSKGHHPRKPR